MKYRVLITGANKGLGKFLSEKFILNGHEVFSHLGHKHFNLSNLDEINSLINEAKSARVNLLVNNAAILCSGKELVNYEQGEIIKMINVNLIAPVLLIHGLISQLNSIININSIAALEPKQNRMVYSAAKCGLKGFSDSLKITRNSINILDVYSSNINSNSNNSNALDPSFVVKSIYDALITKKDKIILDGRK